jgi:hypothetical protein
LKTWHLTLTLLEGTFAVCRLAPAAQLPAWADADPFASITRTCDELSITCLQSGVPDDVQAERDWRCLKVEGPFDLEGTIGVMASLAVPLAEAGISLFAVSAYDTDYLLLKEKHLTRAIAALAAAGHTVSAP